ncbi:hypothetical protein BDD43_0954 [Mucilaginibacter gracilis]|uniref:Uncharacterized protein n=1 Tax=Mucilaginibacter gracilis TaxID=423350 RepID=A0A495IXL9_9SPHI|nr:hypothetical protein BDD43_0954 [Mucilaginibacter gracilis]
MSPSITLTLWTLFNLLLLTALIIVIYRFLSNRVKGKNIKG